MFVSKQGRYFPGGFKSTLSLWPVHPPDLNIIEFLCTVLEKRMLGKFPSPVSFQQLTDVLLEEF